MTMELQVFIASAQALVLTHYATEAGNAPRAPIFNHIHLAGNRCQLATHYNQRWTDWLAFTCHTITLKNEKGFMFNQNT